MAQTPDPQTPEFPQIRSPEAVVVVVVVVRDVCSEMEHHALYHCWLQSVENNGSALQHLLYTRQEQETEACTCVSCLMSLICSSLDGSTASEEHQRFSCSIRVRSVHEHEHEHCCHHEHEQKQILDGWTTWAACGYTRSFCRDSCCSSALKVNMTVTIVMRVPFCVHMKRRAHKTRALAPFYVSVCHKFILSYGEISRHSVIFHWWWTSNFSLRVHLYLCSLFRV